VLLTVTATFEPATDLGYLLHKHPGRVQSFGLSVGTAHVFYPEATGQRCTAALLLEVDPVGLVRGARGGGGDGLALGQYVNDRPYAASSMLAVAMKEVFRTALAGRCDARPELAAAQLPLLLRVPALPCRGGPELAGRLFGPLGWAVQADTAPLDPAFPDWGPSPYVDLRLSGRMRLADALNHLYVLLPVLDGGKHYWVSTEEVDKLVRAAGGWLAAHPERDLIIDRYLAHRRELGAAALARLAEADDADPAELDNSLEGPRVLAVDGPLPVAVPEGGGRVRTGPDPVEPGGTRGGAPVPAGPESVPVAEGGGRALPLAGQRRRAVLEAVLASGARRVGDLGCGDGALLRDLLAHRSVEHVLGVDVSVRALQAAARGLRLDRMSEPERARVELFQSSLTYRDDRLAGLDAAVLVEVVEHVEPDRLGALERVVFAHAAPGTVLVTTPNAEYNVRFAALPAGALRHRDHRFEWTRAQFRDWAGRVAAGHGYRVRFAPVGPVDPEVGPPTQLAVFERAVPA
jgi:SAM-dependent methyltransferase